MDNAPSENAIRKPAFLIGALYLIFLILFAVSVYELPARVASHFDYAGVADDWMSRKSYLLSTFLTAIFLPALPAVAFFSLRCLPSRLVRLPAGWMTPEQRDKTFHELLVFGLQASAILLMIQIALLISVLVANQASPAHLPKWLSSVPMGAFFGGFFVWFLQISRYFKNPPSSEPR